jgi:hypothetical protein
MLMKNGFNKGNFLGIYGLGFRAYISIRETLLKEKWDSIIFFIRVYLKKQCN